MHISKNIFFGLTSFACLTLGSSDLLATTLVSVSNGDGSGTLPAAIDAVNGATSTSPILIESGVSPILSLYPGPTITTSMTIGSDRLGGSPSRAINGNSYTLNVTAGDVIFTADITLENFDNIDFQGGTTTIAGPIINNYLFLGDPDGATLILSGDNSSNYNQISVYTPSIVTLLAPISPSSTFWLTDGTLNAKTNLSLSELLSCGGTINTDSGYTTTISTLFMNCGGMNLTLNGPGINVIETINMKYSPNQITGILGGSSGLTLEGSGTLTLNSINTYTGSTAVGFNTTDVVTLQINSEALIGNKNANINVNSNCTLNNNGRVLYYTLINYGTVSGTGYFDGQTLTVAEAGFITPGNSPGLLTINGDVNSLSGSTIQIFLSPEESSELSVSGILTLDPDVTLKIVPETSCYPKTKGFSIIAAGGGLNGTFSQVDTGSILLTADLTYGSHGVLITVNRGNLGDLGLHGNALVVAKAVDSLIDGGHSLCSVMGDFILSSKEEIAAALESLQPSLFKGLTISQENNAVKVQDTLGYRMQVELDSTHCHPLHSKDEIKSTCEREKKPFQVWVNGMGDALHQTLTPPIVT